MLTNSSPEKTLTLKMLFKCHVLKCQNVLCFQWFHWLVWAEWSFLSALISGPENYFQTLGNDVRDGTWVSALGRGIQQGPHPWTDTGSRKKLTEEQERRNWNQKNRGSGIQNMRCSKYDLMNSRHFLITSIWAAVRLGADDTRVSKSMQGDITWKKQSSEKVP